MPGADALVDDLQALVDDDLRVVAEYDRDGYDIRFSRDNVERRIQNQADDIHRDLVLEGISRDHLEELFDAGDLHCTMHRFDDVTAFHFAETEYRGLFVSVDSDADVPMASFADICWHSLS